MDPSGDPETYEVLRRRARHVVYERMALISAVVWALGTLLIFIAIVPDAPRPQPRIMVSMLVPLVPAALPWLFYGMISDRVAQRWMKQRANGDSL
jgi:hypothetical protein